MLSGQQAKDLSLRRQSAVDGFSIRMQRIVVTSGKFIMDVRALALMIAVFDLIMHDAVAHFVIYFIISYSAGTWGQSMPPNLIPLLSLMATRSKSSSEMSIGKGPCPRTSLLGIQGVKC